MTIRQKLIRIATDAAAAMADRKDALDHFFRIRHNPDGGFRGKGPQSDLYYTGFAVLALLAMEIPFNRDKTIRFLESHEDGSGLDLSHLAVLVRLCNILKPDFQTSPLRTQLTEQLRKFKTPEGGYNHLAHQPAGSAYGCFLALGICEDLQLSLSDIEPQMISFLSAMYKPDGGYLNETAIPVTSVPSTSAALVALDLLDQKEHVKSIEWLLSNIDESGGFRVIQFAPVPDLLSTAVGLFALKVIGADLSPVRNQCRAFVESLWDDDIGFRPNPYDQWSDCEYTFYGLLALGALADE